MRKTLTAAVVLALASLASAEGVEQHTYWRTPDGSVIELKHRGTTFGDRHVRGRPVHSDGSPQGKWTDPPASGTPDRQGECTESETFSVGDQLCKVDQDDHRDDSSLYVYDSETETWKRATATTVGDDTDWRNGPPAGTWAPPPAPPEIGTMEGDPSAVGGLPGGGPWTGEVFVYVDTRGPRVGPRLGDVADVREIAPVA